MKSKERARRAGPHWKSRAQWALTAAVVLFTALGIAMQFMPRHRTSTQSQKKVPLNHCVTGCPCGASCIPCSRRCRLGFIPR